MLVFVVLQNILMSKSLFLFTKTWFVQFLTVFLVTPAHVLPLIATEMKSREANFFFLMKKKKIVDSLFWLLILSRDKTFCVWGKIRVSMRGGSEVKTVCELIRLHPHQTKFEKMWNDNLKYSLIYPFFFTFYFSKFSEYNLWEILEVGCAACSLGHYRPLWVTWFKTWPEVMTSFPSSSISSS